MKKSIALGGMIAVCSLAVSGQVLAADMPRMPRLEAAPPPVQTFDDSTGYYLRGDVGVGILSVGKLGQADLATNGGKFLSKSIGDTTYLSFGAGAKLTNWIRADVTAEYRGAVHLGGYDNLTLSNQAGTTKLQANTIYSGHYSSTVALVNVYGDLGTWNKITPYVGVGVGAAYNRMTGFTDSSIGSFTNAGLTTVTPTSGVLGDKGKFAFAWALMAGASYDISDNAKLDLGYRYINLGGGTAATSGIINCSCGSIGQPLTVHSLHAHELRVGIRWSLDQAPKTVAQAPIIAKY